MSIFQLDYLLPILIAILVVFIWGFYILAKKTFKKIPWEFVGILVKSFFATILKIWKKNLPKMWLAEYNRRRKK